MSADAAPTANFFNLIHSATGWRCLFTLPDRRHYWFQNSADLARAALELDARGLAVFHSCATFDRQERKQDYVAGLKCFWFDIDAGPGKHYATAADGYRDFEVWRSKSGFPPATIIGSGGGIHVYWGLKNTLDPAQWRVAANRLRALAAQHGLAIDAGSTIDSARILRPPGTHNRKLLDANGKKLADVGGPERPVLLGPLHGPYSLADLHLEIATEAPMEVPVFLKGVRDVGIFNVGANDRTSDQDSDPAQIATHCPQVARLRDARGNLPEPEWYAVLGILIHCGDAGRNAAHSWSSGDVRYRPEDTDAKLQQYLGAADGPTTCARFGQLNSGPCITCPHAGKITSPIQLGRLLPTSTVAPAPPGPDLPLLPKGFKWSGQRLCIERKPTEDDPSDHHIITEYPVVVGALQETERSRRISLLFRSWEPMKRDWREFVLNMGELVGQGGHSKVADQGVVVGKRRWENFVAYASGAANDYRGTQHYGTRYEQFGWKPGPAFVLGEEILRQGAPPTRVHGNEEVERRGALMAPQGDLRAWVEAANKLIGHEGMEAHAFMLLCAFAAVLYYFTGEPGVTFVHGATRSSGKGKSAILDTGMWVWGERDATSVIERDTMVAKFITLGTLCHLPVFFDELRFPTPEETKHYVLQATLGRDKQRGRAEGGLRADQLGWATLHISAANLSLTDTVRADGSEVAQAARIFEFSLTLPDSIKTTEGDALKKILHANCGTAGRAFVQAVLDNYAWVEQAVPARMRHYEEVMNAGPEERFVLRLLGCVDVAGALVKKHGLLECDLSKVMAWAVNVQQGNAGRLAEESKIDAGAVVSRMVNDLQPHVLVMPKGSEVGKPSLTVPLRQPHGELKARLEVDSRKLLVDSVAVRLWMQEHHYSFTEMQKELLQLGVLKDGRVRRTLGAGTSYTVGQVWCWQIDGAHPLLADLIDTVAVVDLDGARNVVPLRGKA